MADVNANIIVNIDSSAALVNLRRLETQIDQFQRRTLASGSAAAASQQAWNRQLLDGINNTGLFNAKNVMAQDSMARLSTSIDKAKLSLGEYTRFAASQLPGMSRVFRREFDLMGQVAESRVKKMQTQYIALGKTVDGVTRAIASTPTGLARGYATDVAMATQRQQLFNKMIDDGSTKLLNWGKNTQWAGRQLMVGFSIPLAALGAVAAKTFMEIDKATVSLRRVYGDLSTTTEEVNTNVDAIRTLGKEYTKYGIAVSETIDISARAAATGATNESLMAATEQTMRFATLGQMDYNQALDTTISLQTAFGTSNEDLGKKVDYLNAVENQTVLTMEDMSLAIPRVATVVKGLGGDVEDLAVMMTAMKEGGISAENAANGLKSGLASLINPTKRATESLASMGININSIIAQNKGNLMGLVKDFGAAIGSLDEFSRQQALEKVFGKFQFARMSALFTNMTNDAGQAARAMDIAGMSAQQLAALADKELGVISESTSVKFQAAMENLKNSIAPVGEAFLKGLTPVMNFVSKVADAFNNLPDGVKNAAAIITAALAGIAPVVLMGFGLLGNGFANLIKTIQFFRRRLAGIKGDAESFRWLAAGELEALTATEALEGAAGSLTGKLLLQKGAVRALTEEYARFAEVAGIANGVMGRTGGRAGKTSGSNSKPALRLAKGGTVPGTGNKDTIPALLTPGESVITKKATQKYAPVLEQMNKGTLPGFNRGYNPPMPRAVAGVGTSAPQTIRNFFAKYGDPNMSKKTTTIIERLQRQGRIGDIPDNVLQAMTKVDIAHRKLDIRKGIKWWNPKNLFQAPGAENLAFEYLSKSETTKSILKQLLSSKEDERMFKKIFVKKNHPTSRDEVDFTINLMKKLEKHVDKNPNDPNVIKYKSRETYKNGWDTIFTEILKERRSGKSWKLAPETQSLIGGYSLGGVSIGQALKTWQTSSRSVRENPGMLAALTPGYTPLKSGMTLHRGTTIGLGRGSEFSSKDEALIFNALKTGDYKSIIGREFSVSGPLSYSQTMEGTMGALTSNADVNRIEFLKAQHALGRKKQAEDLKAIKRLEASVARGTGPVDLYARQLAERKARVAMYSEGQKALGREIKSLAPKGYQRMQMEQQFYGGGENSLIDVNRQNQLAGQEGTFMGKNVAREQEFIAPPSKIRISGVKVDPKTGIPKLITETLDTVVPGSRTAYGARKPMMLAGGAVGVGTKISQSLSGLVKNKRDSLSLYLGARHGAKSQRNWVDPLSQSGMKQGVTETRLGPGAYLSNNPGTPRSYAGMEDLRSKMGQSGAGYIYRTSRNPLAIMKVLKGKGYLPYDELINMGLMENKLQRYDANAYKKLRDMGYQGVFAPQNNGEMFIVDFVSGSKWYNKPALANAKNPFGRKQGKADRTQLAQFEESQTKQRQAQKARAAAADEGFFLNKGGVSLQKPKMFANGGLVPGVGNKDTIPALLTPGESVITKQATKKYAPVLHQMNKGTLPGFNEGMVDSQTKKSYSGKIPTLQMIDALPEGPMKRRYLREFSIAYKASLAAAKETGSIVQVDKAHLQQTASGKEKDFDDVKKWIPQSSVENQFSSLMSEKLVDPKKERLAKQAEEKNARGVKISAEEAKAQSYVKNIKSQNKAAETKRSVFEKSLLAVSGENGKHTKETAKLMKDIKAGTALNHEQLVMQTKTLEHQAANTKALVDSGLDKKVQAKYLARSAEVAAAGRSRMESVSMSEAEASQLRAQYRGSGIEDVVAGKPAAAPSAQDAAQERLRRKIERSRISAQRQQAGKQRKIDAQERARSQSEAKQMAAEERIAQRQAAANKGGIRGRLGKMGGGFGKVAGGLSMTMGMASMLPMMASDEQGKFMGMDSGTAMMGMMGGSAALGVFQMLPPHLVGPVAAVTAGLAIVGATIWKLNDEWNKTTHAVSDFRDKLYGSSDLIQNVAKELGRETAAQTSGMYNALTTSNVTQESMQFGQQFMDTESGKKMLQDMKDFSKQGGNVADALKNNLTKMIVSGIMTPEEAQSVAIQMGTQLNNQTLAMNVNAKINEIIGPNGEKMKNNMVSVLASISPVLDEKELEKQVNTFYAQRSSFVGGGVGQFFSGLTTALQGEEYTKAQMKVQAYSNSVVQSAELERQARAQVNLEFRQGVITLEEYNKQIAEIGSSSITNKSFNQLRNTLTQVAPQLMDLGGNRNPDDTYTTKNATERTVAYGQPTQQAPRPNQLAIGPTILQDSKIIDEAVNNVTKSWNIFTEQISMGEEVKKRIEDIADSMSIVNGVSDKLERSRFLLDVASGAINENVLQSLMYLPDSEIDKLNEAEGGLKGLSDQLGIISQYPALTQKVIDIKVAENSMSAEDRKHYQGKSFSERVAEIKKSVGEILALPPAFQKTFEINIDTASAADLEGWAKTAVTVKDYWPLLEKLNPAIDLKSFIETNIMANGGKISPEKLVDIINKGGKAVDDLASTKKDVVKKATIEFITITDGKKMGANVWSYISANFDKFNKLQLQDKVAVITIVKQMVTIGEETKSYDELAAAGYGNFFIPATVSGEDMAIKAKKKEAESAYQAGLIGTGGKKEGGGEKQLSFLEQLTKDTDANMKIFPAMVAKVKKKFPGIPQSILDAMGTGPEGLKNFQEVLKANADKVRKLFTRYRKAAFNQTLEEMQSEITATRKKTNVANKIQDLPEEVKAIIMANDGLIEQISVVKKGSPTYDQAIAQARELAAAQKNLENSTKSASEKLSENIDILNAALSQQELEIRNKNAAAFLATNGKTTEEMQRQVEKNQRLIDTAQERINVKQQEIEKLNRESDIRNRISESLNNQLEDMSKQEQIITESYQKRIDALNQVSAINDHILDQQNKQLGLAQALSTGDVYAAANAAQEMQSSQVRYAQQQQSAALQQGMKNQIENLRTPEGLTRKQAEEQIDGIRKQTYQTSLAIRDIDDAIYKIQTETIKPLADQNAEYNKKLQYNQQDLDWQLATTQFQGKSREYWIQYLSDTQTAKANLEAMGLPLDSLIGKMRELAKASAEVKTYTGGGSSIVSETSSGEAFSGMSGKEIKELEGSDIGRYLQWSGGGMGLNLAGVAKGFSTGGQVGMDSVPAMLTPGEFVMRKSAVNKYGSAMFEKMNMGAFSMPKYNVRGPQATAVKAQPNVSTISAPVYNTYSINVPVTQPGASADEIANKVMTKIRNVDNSSIRRINGY